jgi:DNA-binding NtrC family response regulator
MSLELPPLRQRADDIPLLINHFLGSAWEIQPEAAQLLQHYSWPGNVRQLINALERAKIMADDHLIRLVDLPREIQGALPVAATATTLATATAFVSAVTATDDLAAIERSKVVEVMRRVAGNKTRAAKSLGVDRRKLYRLVEKYQIRDEEWGRVPSGVVRDTSGACTTTAGS